MELPPLRINRADDLRKQADDWRAQAEYLAQQRRLLPEPKPVAEADKETRLREHRAMLAETKHLIGF